MPILSSKSSLCLNCPNQVLQQSLLAPMGPVENYPKCLGVLMTYLIPSSTAKGRKLCSLEITQNSLMCSNELIDRNSRVPWLILTPRPCKSCPPNADGGGRSPRINSLPLPNWFPRKRQLAQKKSKKELLGSDSDSISRKYSLTRIASVQLHNISRSIIHQGAFPE